MNATELIKTALPWIGTALGGPFGGMAAGFIGDKLGIPAATVESVKAVLGGMPPEKLAELTASDQEFKLKLAALGYDSLEKIASLEVEALVAVNKTMQVETASEHWPSYSWRPFIGFQLGLYLASMWILPLFHVVPAPLSEYLVLAIGSILGVASWFRGKAQADPTVQNSQIISQKG